MLTHARGVFGVSISYDASARAMREAGLDVFLEYPDGNAFTAIQKIPEAPAEYTEMWYGDPMLWRLSPKSPCLLSVGYSRAPEVPIPGSDAYTKVDLLFMASEEARRFHEKRLGRAVHLFPGGIFPDEFSFIERDFESSPFTFLHGGAIHERKGTDIVCAAFAQAFQADEDVALHIISVEEPGLFSRLREKYAGDKRMQFSVKVVSDRKKMADAYYRDGHCYVYASLLEAWPNMMIEPMATGLPCIVSKASSMKHLFHGRHGWWIEMDGVVPSQNDLADKMVYAYQHRKECQAKGQAAARYVARELTWKNATDKMLPILKEAIG